jgi:hypothetical protein
MGLKVFGPVGPGVPIWGRHFVEQWRGPRAKEVTRFGEAICCRIPDSFIEHFSQNDSPY